MNLLSRARKINAMLQNTDGNSVNYNEIAKTLQGVIGANVFLLSGNGNLIGFSILQEVENERIKNMLKMRQFPDEYNKGLLQFKNTTANLEIDNEYTAFPVENKELFKNGLTTIVPIIGGGERLGTLILSRLDNKFENDDLILAEYGSTVVGMEILREISSQKEDKVRSQTIAQMAISSLSFSEIKAIECIFEELGSSEGIVVASKIADRAGITRSVIVNAMRKLESAGVIDSRSLGMKGTYIKVLNINFFDELAKLNQNKLA